jgi:hypothetical protein
MLPEFKSDTQTRETKALAGAFSIKNENNGEVEAVFATLGVVDRDGDIIQKGAVKNGQKVTMSAYGHDAIFGARPAGKGTVTERGDDAVFNGRAFLSTRDGQDTWAVLKEMGGDQQWSFGYRVLQSNTPTDAQKKDGARRVITSLDIFEVSPVLEGAGIGTHTTAVKEASSEKFERLAELAAKGIVAEKAEQDAATKAAAELKAAEDARIAAERAAAEKAEADRKEAERIAAETKAREQQRAIDTEYQRFVRTNRTLGVI